MIEDWRGLFCRINTRRMRELLFDFACIPTPPHSTAVATEWYAGCLRACGAAEVQILRDQPATPSLIAGFPGVRRAPILQLQGRLGARQPGPRDVIATPQRIVGPGLLSGKAELIAAAEAARVLAEDGPLPGGGLLFVVTPRAALELESDPLPRLIARGMLGSAVLVAGGESMVAPVAGLGAGTFRAHFFPRPEERDGASTYGGARRTEELTAKSIEAATLFMALVRKRQRALSRHCDPLLGSETLAIQEIRGGALDEPPAGCLVRGRWQWLPERHSSEIFRELEQMADRAARHSGTSYELVLKARNEGYMLAPGEPIVDSLRSAYAQVSGSYLPLGATAASASGALFYGQHGVPVVSHGADPSTRNTPDESITVSELVRLTRTYLCLYLNFLTWAPAIKHVPTGTVLDTLASRSMTL